MLLNMVHKQALANHHLPTPGEDDEAEIINVEEQVDGEYNLNSDEIPFDLSNTSLNRWKMRSICKYTIDPQENAVCFRNMT